jgi:hypothetical protein
MPRDHSALETDGGGMIGRDPRTMTRGELRAMGHEPMPVLAAMRARCIDCCAGSPDEVRRCTAVKCGAWPFRMGTNPWRAPISEERREAARARALKTFGNSSGAVTNPPLGAGRAAAATRGPGAGSVEAEGR